MNQQIKAKHETRVQPEFSFNIEFELQQCDLDDELVSEKAHANLSHRNSPKPRNSPLLQDKGVVKESERKTFHQQLKTQWKAQKVKIWL